MSKQLNNIISDMNKLFEENLNYHDAHQKSMPLLKKMAEDTSILHEIIKINIKKGNYYTTKLTTVIDLEITKNEKFTLIGHCFPPLPDRTTDITHHSIHHHGQLLLTTVSAFGPGYNSIIFKKNFSVDPISKIAVMHVDKYYQNTLHNVEFIDSNTPHVVFYPSDLSITFALWSNEKKTSIDRLKKNKFIQNNKEFIKKIVSFLPKSLNKTINTVDGYDFYPDNGLIYQIKDRRGIPVPRSKVNYIQNLFYIMQKTKFNDFYFIRNLHSVIPKVDFSLFEKFISAFLSNEPIPDLFPKEHLNIPKVNIPKADILGCYNDSDF